MDKNEESSLENEHAPVARSFRTDGIKQRLIGAIVLVSLAVIFLPMIFDQPHQEKKNIVIPIPERPPEKLVTFESPKPPELKATGNKEKSLEIIHSSNQTQANSSETLPSRKSNTMIEAEPSKKVVAATTKPESIVINDEEATNSQPVISANNVSKPASDVPKSLEQAWVVQLGTFGNKENAMKLRDKARAQGYSTHTTDLLRDGKTLTRVFSGPFINRGDADQVKALLDKKFAVKSIVVQFSE